MSGFLHAPHLRRKCEPKSRRPNNGSSLVLGCPFMGHAVGLYFFARSNDLGRPIRYAWVTPGGGDEPGKCPKVFHFLSKGASHQSFTKSAPRQRKKVALSLLSPLQAHGGIGDLLFYPSMMKRKLLRSLFIGLQRFLSITYKFIKYSTILLNCHFPLFPFVSFSSKLAHISAQRPLPKGK